MYIDLINSYSRQYIVILIAAFNNNKNVYLYYGLPEKMRGFS